MTARRPLFAVDYRDDPRGDDVRAAVVQEGFDTLCTAPLLDGNDLLGMLNVYHDQPHHWTPDELDTIGRAGDPGRASPSGPPRTTSGWRPGRRSSSRSSSSERG